MEDFVTIETHFGVPEHFIRANTRNRCSEDLAIIIEQIAKILYPSDTFEVYLLPAQPGSYKDVLKFVKKHKVGTAIGAVATIGTLTLGFLNYRDSHETHKHDKLDWIIDDTKKCLDLRKYIEDLKQNYEFQNIPEEKLKEVCGDLNLKNKKNDIYNTLARDGMIQNNEIILKDANDKLITSQKVERSDFANYIEPVQDQKLSQENLEGIIEIISPVFKQKREGRGISWRGMYWGEDVYFKSVPLIKNGEEIEFYMQDQDFKTQITNKERIFTAGDNMRVIFDLTGDLKDGQISNRAVYIKEVMSYNEDIVQHKANFSKKSNNKNTDTPLF